jgi:prolyl oligopeptidase
MQKALTAAVLLLAACGTSTAPTDKPMQKIAYPETRKDTTVVDDYFGTKVADPYRWLENDTSAETADWVKRENAVTNAYLADIPFRDAIAKRYEELFNFPKTGAPSKVGDLFFTYRNSGLQNQSVIYVRHGLEGKDTVFIDPNVVDPKGTTSIGLMGSSKDNRYMAVSIQKAGSDWQDITLWDLKSMKPMADTLLWAKFSGVAWFKDGFFYSRYPEPKKGMELSGANQWQRVYYHKLGDPQAKDALVWASDTEPNLYVGAGTTEGEEFATLYISTGTDGFEQYFYDLRKGVLPTPATQWTPLQRGFNHKTSIMAFEPKSGQFLVMTDVNAPNYRLVGVDPAQPDSANWKDVIPAEKRLVGRCCDRWRKPLRQLLEGCHHTHLPLRYRRHRWAGNHLARHRHRGRFRRAARRHVFLLQLHLVHRSGEHLQIRLRHGQERPVLPSGVEVRSGTIHHRAGILHEQGRHQSAHVHRP